MIISINSSVMQISGAKPLWWVDICNSNSRNLCLQHWWHAEGFLSSLVCMFIYIWLFYGNRSLYVMVLGSGMVQWNISAHTSQSCQQLPSIPRICCFLLWGTSNFFLACSSCQLASLLIFVKPMVQSNFDAAIEPVEFCREKTGGAAKYEKVVYGEHLVKKVLTNFVM